MEFELEIEIVPNGLRFEDNAVSNGVTWGLQAQYRYDINQHWQIGTGLTLGLGELMGRDRWLQMILSHYKVTQFQQSDLTIDYLF